jgi:cell division protein FtsB
LRGCDLTGEKTISEFIRIVVAVLLAYALVRYAAVQKTCKETERTLRTLCSEVQMLREETEALKSALETEPEDSEIEKLARERLGLVLPDETIFYFAQAEDKEG